MQHLQSCFNSCRPLRHAHGNTEKRPDTSARLSLNDADLMVSQTCNITLHAKQRHPLIHFSVPQFHLIDWLFQTAGATVSQSLAFSSSLVLYQRRAATRKSMATSIPGQCKHTSAVALATLHHQQP